MPKLKKKQQTSSSDSDSGPDDRNPPPSKKSKESSKPEATGNEGDGGTIWTLEGMRQIRINEFRGKKLVDVREFYEKDGKVLPGKKGISLSASQWKKLLAVADEVNRALGE